MVDLDVLEAMGSTQARLREIFTAAPPATEAERAALPAEQVSKLDEDRKLRDKFESDINRRFSESISYNLQNYQMYSSMDLAMDCAPINKETYPLMLYAQGKLDLGKCAKELKDLPCADKYVTKDDKGTVVGINLPKFFEVNFNLIRSVITRRLAAQANKYNALYPYYKYEPRSTSLVGKLRADVLSQIMDIMVDNFDLRHHDVQVLRDTMVYGHCVDFVRSAWERELQLVDNDDFNPELKLDDENPKFKAVVTKEGVGWLNPHPTRVFWDNAYPLSSINSDMGCEFIGFWDVVRFGDIANNPKFWNRSAISYSSTIVQLFSTYAQYFSQYYCTIIPPCDQRANDLSSQNDRSNNIGLYAQDMKSSSMIIANYFKKIVPKDWGVGDYPYPVWLRMMIAGDKTVVHAEFLPSRPACYCGINENDNRQVNISIAMELMPYQDQMTQLLSLLMLILQSSNFRVLAINTDLCTPEQIADFRKQAQAQNRYPTCHVFEYSLEKMQQTLPSFNINTFISLVQTNPSAAIPQIFQAMSQLVQLAERLMALSPHELGQPAPREISATETNMMAGTTETIYGFISDALDEFRSAKKQVLYESYMVCGDQGIRVPIVNRYTKSTITKAGFEILQEDDDTFIDPAVPSQHTIIGTKEKLLYNYIFTSRDGALRSVNTQSANTLTQLLGVLMNPIILQKIKPEMLYEIINEILRLAGASSDFKIELEEGESNTFGQDKQQQMEQVLQQLTQHAEQDAKEIQAVEQKVQELGEMMKELTAEMKRIDSKPTSVQVDPMKFLQSRQKMQHDEQQASLRLAEGSQKIRHAEEDHSLDQRLKRMKAEQEASAYSK